MNMSSPAGVPGVGEQHPQSPEGAAEDAENLQEDTPTETKGEDFPAGGAV